MNLPNWLKSSDGSGKLSLRVKSALVAVLPALLIIARLMGYEISNEEGNLGIELLVATVVAVETLVAAVLQLHGWGLRNYRKKNKLGAYAGH